MTHRIFFFEKILSRLSQGSLFLQEEPFRPYGVTGRVIPATVTDSTVDRSRISSKIPL